MANNAILMSIRPQYADKIFGGTKTVELRRIKPKLLHEDVLVFVYVSSPVKSLVGAFSVASVMEKPLLALWKNVKGYAGISRSDFFSYFQGLDRGVAIFIKNIWLLPKPIHLSDLKKQEDRFYPPQSFRYTTIQKINSL